MSYPQHGGYGAPPPGYPPPGMYPPPKKSNTGVIVGVVGAAVAVVLAVVLVVVLTGGDDDKDTASGGLPDPTAVAPGPNLPKGSGGGSDEGSDSSGSDSGSDSDGGGSGGSGDGGPSPEAMADEVVRVVEQHETETIRRYACTEQQAADLYSELARLDGVEIDAEVNDVQKSGDTAQASITMSAAGQSEDFTVEMAKNDDGLWCVTGI